MNMLRPELLVNLPKETLDQCQFSRFELLLTLTGCPCQGRYPLVDVLLDDTVIFTGHVDRERLHFNRQVIDVDSIILSIRYKGKTNRDTTVDNNGNITENQCVHIAGAVINGVDLIKTNIIYGLGNYTFVLDSEKEKYYREHNLSIEPNHSLEMGENGEWNIKLPVPVLTGLCNLVAFEEEAEKWQRRKLLDGMYKKIKNIRKLEKKINELNTNK